MSEQQSQPPTPEEVSRDLLGYVEAQRKQSDNFTWLVPTFALTAEAFLLTIALG